MEVFNTSHSWVQASFGDVSDWMSKHNTAENVVALVAIEVLSVADIATHLGVGVGKLVITVILLPPAIFDSLLMQGNFARRVGVMTSDIPDHFNSAATMFLGVFEVPLASLGATGYGDVMWKLGTPPERIALRQRIQNGSVDLAAEVKLIKALPAGAEKIGRSEEILRVNYRLEDVRGDGNCCLRSIVKGLHPGIDPQREDVEIAKMRREMVAYMRKYEGHYKNFMDEHVDDPGRLSAVFKAYCDRMSMNGTWIGQPELVALSDLYRINIQIHRPGSVDIDAQGRIVSQGHETFGNHWFGRTVAVYYHNWHYQVLLPRTG